MKRKIRLRNGKWLIADELTLRRLRKLFPALFDPYDMSDEEWEHYMTEKPNWDKTPYEDEEAA